MRTSTYLRTYGHEIGVEDAGSGRRYQHAEAAATEETEDGFNDADADVVAETAAEDKIKALQITRKEAAIFFRKLIECIICSSILSFYSPFNHS